MKRGARDEWSATGLATAAVVGYLAGTVPSADVAARVGSRGTVDLRSAGSGNPGGANAAQLLGRRWGIAVIAADMAKAALACRLGGSLAGATGANVAGTGAVVGHCYPIWSGFQGGKGVACSAGQCLATFPVYFPIDLAVALAGSSKRWRHRAFASTVIASTAWVIGGVVWWRRRWPNLWGPEPSVALPLAAAVSSAVIIGRFRAARGSAGRPAKIGRDGGHRVGV